MLRQLIFIIKTHTSFLWNQCTTDFPKTYNILLCKFFMFYSDWLISLSKRNWQTKKKKSCFIYVEINGNFSTGSKRIGIWSCMLAPVNGSKCKCKGGITSHFKSTPKINLLLFLLFRNSLICFQGSRLLFQKESCSVFQLLPYCNTKCRTSS